MLEPNQRTCEKSNDNHRCCIGNEAIHSFIRSSHARLAMSMLHRRKPQIKNVQQTTKDLNDDRFSVWFVIISWMSWPAGMSASCKKRCFCGAKDVLLSQRGMTSRAVTVLQTLNRSVILIHRTVVFACSLSALRCQSYHTHQGRWLLPMPPPPTLANLSDFQITLKKKARFQVNKRRCAVY